MGSSKFFFSGMIQNNWLYKLKYMSKTKSQKSTKTRNQLNTKSAPPPATHAPPQPHNLCQERKSYHFTRDLNTPHPPNPNCTNSAFQLPTTPTKSSKKRQSIKKQRMPSYRASSVSTDTSFRIRVESGSICTKPYSTADDYPPYHHSSSSEDDNNSIFPCIVSKNGDFNLIPQVELPTIVTKTTAKSNKNEEARKYINSPIRKVTVKLRTNSPRLLASKRFAQVNGRKSVSTSGSKRRSLSESVAVIKLSQDPYKDFKESMVEMIMVNNMRTPKDLEDLLVCYLSLNSDKYHDLIIKVFKQIWLETTNNIKFFK